MIVYLYKYRLMRRAMVSCSDDFEVSDRIRKQKPDLVFFDSVKPFKGLERIDHSAGLTYVYDFVPGDTDEMLFAKLSKHLRYDIRSCQNDSSVAFHLYQSDEITRKIIIDACTMANDMMAAKGLKTVVKPKPFVAQAKAGCLVVSVSYINGVPFTYHVYSVDGQNAICLLISTSYRQDEVQGQKGSAIHRAHCFFDLSFFQQKSYRRFDWGGLFDGTGNNGIDKFKMRFPGHVETMAKTIIPITLKGRLFLWAKRFLGRH